MPNPGAQGNLYVYDEVPYRNLATNNANYLFSLQTGAKNTTDDLNGDGTVDATDFGVGDADGAQQPTDPADANYGLWFKNLRWEHFSAELTTNGTVILTWKGQEITPRAAWQPSSSRVPGASFWLAVPVAQERFIMSITSGW